MIKHAALVISLVAVLLCAQTPATHAQNDTETFVINMRDTDIAVFAEQISTITKRTLILNPALAGNVSIVSAEPLAVDQVWSLFQSVLRTRGYVAVPMGALWQVVPEAEALASGQLDTDGFAGQQDVITRLIRLARLPSSEAVRVLRPLVAQSGYIEALSDPNAIVLTDTLENVNRLEAIAKSFDNDTARDAEVIRFNFASATDVGRAISQVLGEAGTGARLSVDAAANLLLVRGTPEDINQIRLLARSMDIAPRDNPQIAIKTKVFRLRFADAEVIATLIQNTVGSQATATNPVAQNLDATTTEDGTFVPIAGDPQEVEAASIQASSDINAVVVRGTSGQIQEIGQVIQALDVRRQQVIIEAAIVEVSGDVADRLGVQLGTGQAGPQGALAATSFANSGTSLQSILLALGDPSAAAIASGLNVGFNGNDFSILVQALSQSTKANLLSTPSLTTMDNEPASIVVGQNVPFRTGSFATDGNTVAPFTTIERRDVGITMEILPRITANGVVRLDISQEVSSLTNANVDGAADLVTNRRLIKTTIMAQDNSTIVLGGLISDDELTRNSKVPLLGDIPVVGELFKSRDKSRNRRTLFVFLRPTILHNTHDVKRTTHERYQRLKTEEARKVEGTLLSPKKVKRLPLEIEGIY